MIFIMTEMMVVFTGKGHLCMTFSEWLPTVTLRTKQEVTGSKETSVGKMGALISVSS